MAALPTSSAGGSVNTATSANRSVSNAQTFGTAATSASRAAAEYANKVARSNWEDAANFNAEQARIQREWQTYMANTVYQRTIEDMQKAGINPVLAANMGLGTASVSGGGAASIGAPNSYMADTYADYLSSSESIGNSESHGSSWNEAGFATFLESMMGLAQGLLGNMNSSTQVSISLEGLGKAVKNLEDQAVEKDFKTYKGADPETGKPKEGYTQHYDSDKGKYLTKSEVNNENWLEGFYRGLRNYTNAFLGINPGKKNK